MEPDNSQHDKIGQSSFVGPLEIRMMGKKSGECEINRTNSSQFACLVEGMIENSCNDLNVLQDVLRLGLKFLDARFIDDSFWFSLMEVKFAPNLRVEAGCGTLQFLLEKGLQINCHYSWRYLALSLRIMYTVPRSKGVIIKMIKERFASGIGHLLDNLKDFQQGNYLIELLSNCFPRKHAERPGVVLPPMMWSQNPGKNDVFFGNLEYPFRGKHGDAQVTNFVYNMFGSQLENVLQVDNISYGTNSGNANDAKNLKQQKNSNGEGYCYVQAIRDCIYIWDGDELFLELNRRFVDVIKTLKGCIRMNIGSTNCVRSPSKTLLEMFLKVKWFQLQSENKAACEHFFQNITNHRKVSEVQTFLLINHVEEEESQEANIEQSIQELPTPTEKLPHPNQEMLRKAQSENSQLITPDHSDAKIHTDEWEISLSSDFQGTEIPLEEVGEDEKQQETPENTKQDRSSLAADPRRHDEQSPLVLAQKRRMVRETTKTLELLKKEFAQGNDPRGTATHDVGKPPAVERSPSLVITKFESKHEDKPKPKQSGKITETFQPHESVENLPQPNSAKSIGRKDISVLDTIFGTSPLHKRTKRQQKLKNFKPVINVPSQDISKVQTRHQKKIIKERQQQLAAKKTSECPLRETPNLKGIKGKKTEPMLNDKGPGKTHGILSSREKKRKQDMEPPANLPCKKLRPLEPPVGSTMADKVLTNPVPEVQNKSLIEKSNTSFDSTTVVDPTFNLPPLGLNTNNAFTDKLQEQIFSSINLFSNELLRKMTIINKELNIKIVRELSEKYQNLFHELQKNFHDDTEDMLHFVGEIKDMLNLPEEKLVEVIRGRKFGGKH